VPNCVTTIELLLRRTLVLIGMLVSKEKAVTQRKRKAFTLSLHFP